MGLNYSSRWSEELIVREMRARFPKPRAERCLTGGKLPAATPQLRRGRAGWKAPISDFAETDAADGAVGVGGDERGLGGFALLHGEGAARVEVATFRGIDR